MRVWYPSKTSNISPISQSMTKNSNFVRQFRLRETNSVACDLLNRDSWQSGQRKWPWKWNIFLEAACLCPVIFFCIRVFTITVFFDSRFFLFQIYRSITPWPVDNVTSTSTQLCRSKLNTRLHHWPVSNRSHGGGKNQSRIVEDLFYWRQTLIEQFSFQTTGSVKVIPFIVF